jgi:hypothetical protein
VKNDKVQSMVANGTGFLLSEQEPGGVWRFWTSRSGAPIDADIDDISVISAVLTLYNQSFDDNKALVSSNKNEEGLFLTWVQENFTTNNVDCVVNANALFYLRENDPAVCSYINHAIKYNESCSVYYPSELALFYSVSRNLKYNLSCFEESRETMIKSTLAHQKSDGSFGTDLDTALALNTLLNCGYTGIEVSDGIDNLLKTQNDDGSWARSMFFGGPRFSWGSEELTTAFAIEAMQHYLLQGVTED